MAQKKCSLPLVDSIETHPGEGDVAGECDPISESDSMPRRWDVCRRGERSRSEQERQVDPCHGERELPQ